MKHGEFPFALTEELVVTFGQFLVTRITTRLRTADPGVIRYAVRLAGDDTPTPLLAPPEMPDLAALLKGVATWLQSEPPRIEAMALTLNSDSEAEIRAQVATDVLARVTRLAKVRAAVADLDPSQRR